MSRKTLIFFSGFMAFLALIFTALGFWQVKRLDWKNNLIAEYEALYEQPLQPLSLSDIINADPATHVRGTLSGTLASEPVFAVNHTKDGLRGADIYGFFVPQNSIEGIFVRLGWVEREADGSVVLPEVMYQTVDISGVWYKPISNRFVPENVLAKRDWYRPDAAVWAQTYDVKVYGPQILAAEQIEPALEVEGLELLSARPTFRNNHKQYAFFWFAMSGVTVLMTLIFLRAQKR